MLRRDMSDCTQLPYKCDGCIIEANTRLTHSAAVVVVIKISPRLFDATQISIYSVCIIDDTQVYTSLLILLRCLSLKQQIIHIGAKTYPNQYRDENGPASTARSSSVVCIFILQLMDLEVFDVVAASFVIVVALCLCITALLMLLFTI